MKILGNYIVLFIFMMGMILADNDDKYREFYEKVLELHNEYRAMHGADPLELDRELSWEAMKIAKAADVKHSPGHNETIGHNIFYEHPSNELNFRNVVNSWYEQEKNYTYKEHEYIPKSTSSFTQIVWRSTQKLGVAVYPGNEFVKIVTTYSPRGNIENKYMNNVVAITNAEDDSSSSSEYQQFYEDMFNLHNKYRELHNAGPLTLDKGLSEAAMRLAKNFGTYVNEDSEMGTNVFFQQDISKLNVRDVFFSWYNEMNKYTYDDDPEMRKKTSGFTQIVWRSTKQIGVAVFPVENLVTIVVTYLPRGNIEDEYMKNVVAIPIPKNGSSSSFGSEKPRSDYRL